MIETKVAQILTSKKVILAAGAEQAVAPEMTFVIYELGEEVKDPETGESLGRLELHKARVKVTQVQPRFSIATTIPHEVTRTRDLIPRFTIQQEYTELVYPELPLDKATATALAEPKLTVKVGDLAHSL